MAQIYVKKTAFRMLSLISIALVILTLLNSNTRQRSLLLGEAERQLSLMKTSVYQHRTNVDEASGRYNYDCSGFLNYSLKRVLLEAYSELPRFTSKRPLAQDYHVLFSSQTQNSIYWERILKATQLKAGDIIAWLRPQDNDSNNTGHVMLVRNEPMVYPDQSNELLVTVIDSTGSPHAQDTRHMGQTGLGSGIIGIIMNSNSEPIAYHWRGEKSRKKEVTSIAFGRIR
jgi:hypothetical protein